MLLASQGGDTAVSGVNETVKTCHSAADLALGNGRDGSAYG